MKILITKAVMNPDSSTVQTLFDSDEKYPAGTAKLSLNGKQAYDAFIRLTEASLQDLKKELEYVELAVDGKDIPADSITSTIIFALPAAENSWPFGPHTEIVASASQRNATADRIFAGIQAGQFHLVMDHLIQRRTDIDASLETAVNIVDRTKEVKVRPKTESVEPAEPDTVVSSGLSEQGRVTEGQPRQDGPTPETSPR